MSITVLAIAAAHSLPPIIGGMINNKKSGVLVGAMIGVTIAITSGNPSYIVPDLLGVAAGTWFGYAASR